MDLRVSERRDKIDRQCHGTELDSTSSPRLTKSEVLAIALESAHWTPYQRETV